MKKLSTKDSNRRIALYTKGLSISQVATKVGVSATAVYSTLKRAGVQMRPVGRHGKASN